MMIPSTNGHKLPTPQVNSGHQQLRDADPGVADVEAADPERDQDLEQPGDELALVRVRLTGDGSTPYGAGSPVAVSGCTDGGGGVA